MNNLIDVMRNSKMPWWYRDFFAKCEWLKLHSGKIEYVKSSKSSLCFGNPNSQGAAFGFLKDVFKFLGDDKQTEEMFINEATSGDGHEYARITRLHSSALLPFLMFCQVPNKESLTIDIQGKQERFSKVHFEVKNWIQPNDTHPSNIDVVLENENVILFLESKFTEYFKRMRHVGIPNRFRGRVKKMLKQKGLTGLTMEKDELVSSDYHYLEGVKQIVAHYMGIEFAATKGEGKFNHGGVQQFLINGRDVYLGEILFDFRAFIHGDIRKGSTRAKCFEDYAGLYQEVTTALSETSEMASPPRCLPEVLTYQGLFTEYPLDENVAQFYQIKK